MGSIQHTIYYCCVSRGGQILYSHSVGDNEIEKLASLCLDKAPPYHKWYFQTMGRKTFGFLIEDGYVYFAIADEGLRNSGVLQFLKHFRDEFRRLAKKGSNRSISNLSSLSVEEQLLPVIHRLITSLENVSKNNHEWQAETSSGLSPSPSIESNGQTEVTASTKAPLLSKSSKKEKKKNKDHVVAMRGIEMEERRKSTDRGVKCEVDSLDSSSLQKDVAYVRTRSGNSSRSILKKWCRLVRIVLAIDAAVCVVLLVIWLIICGGTQCLQ